MNKIDNIRMRRYQTLFVISIILLPLFASGCASNKSKALKTVEEHIKRQSKDISDVKLDLFHTSPKFQDKAYISVTVAHGFASADGKPQREFLAYILEKKGDDWAIADGNNPPHTTSPDQAEKYLGGQK